MGVAHSVSSGSVCVVTYSLHQWKAMSFFVALYFTIYLLKKNPILGVIIYPLLGLGAIWLGHYYSQSLSLLEKTGGQLKVNTFVYIAYQLGGIKLVMGFFILLALFFFYLGYTYLKKLGNTQK